MIKILYLERNSCNTKLMQLVAKFIENHAENKKIEVVGLHDEKEIEQSLASQQYNLIISNTYGVTGKEIIKRLRNGNLGELNRSTRAIAYTSTSFDEEKVECLNAGFNSFLIIPNMDIIKEEIEGLLK